MEAPLLCLDVQPDACDIATRSSGLHLRCYCRTLSVALCMLVKRSEVVLS